MNPKQLTPEYLNSLPPKDGPLNAEIRYGTGMSVAATNLAAVLEAQTGVRPTMTALPHITEITGLTQPNTERLREAIKQARGVLPADRIEVMGDTTSYTDDQGRAVLHVRNYGTDPEHYRFVDGVREELPLTDQQLAHAHRLKNS